MRRVSLSVDAGGRHVGKLIVRRRAARSRPARAEAVTRPGAHLVTWCGGFGSKLRHGCKKSADTVVSHKTRQIEPQLQARAQAIACGTKLIVEPRCDRFVAVKALIAKLSVPMAVWPASFIVPWCWTMG